LSVCVCTYSLTLFCSVLLKHPTKSLLVCEMPSARALRSARSVQTAWYLCEPTHRHHDYNVAQALAQQLTLPAAPSADETGAGANGGSVAAKVPTAAEMAAVSTFSPQLVSRCAALMDQCTAQELGLLAWSVTRGRLDVCAANGEGRSSTSSSGGGACMLGALMQAARVNSEDLHWRGIAHIELVARLHTHSAACASADSGGIQLHRKRKRDDATAGTSSDTLGLSGGCTLDDQALDVALATRMATVLHTMAMDSDTHNIAPSLLCREAVLAGSLASSCALNCTPQDSGAMGTVLLVGDDVGGGTHDALLAMGYAVVHWRRFAWEGVAAGALPEPASWPRTHVFFSLFFVGHPLLPSGSCVCS